MAGPGRRHDRLRRLRPLALHRRPQDRTTSRTAWGGISSPPARPARRLDRGPPARPRPRRTSSAGCPTRPAALAASTPQGRHRGRAATPTSPSSPPTRPSPWTRPPSTTATRSPPTRAGPCTASCRSTWLRGERDRRPTARSPTEAGSPGPTVRLAKGRTDHRDRRSPRFTGDASPYGGGDPYADYRTADFPFTHLADLADRRLGAGVIAANDEFFAERENLLVPGPRRVRPRALRPQGQDHGRLGDPAPPRRSRAEHPQPDRRGPRLGAGPARRARRRSAASSSTPPTSAATTRRPSRSRRAAVPRLPVARGTARATT